MKYSMLSLALVFFLISCSSKESRNNTTTDSTAVSNQAKVDLIVAIGKVEPESGIVNLSAQAGGIVTNVFKNDGDKISRQELLVQLDDDLEQGRINEIKAQIQTQRSQILIEQTQLKEAFMNLANKQSLLLKTKRMMENGAETQQTFDDLSTDVGVLELSLERLKAKIQLASGKLNELVSQLKTAQTEAEKKRLISPYDGTLLDLQISKGEAVSQYSTFADFSPKGNLIVRAEVDELFSSKVLTGQKVDIVYTGSEKVVAVGEVELISPYLKKKSLFSERANDQEDRRVLEIRIALKDADGLLINSKVECKIKLN